MSSDVALISWIYEIVILKSPGNKYGHLINEVNSYQNWGK